MSIPTSLFNHTRHKHSLEDIAESEAVTRPLSEASGIEIRLFGNHHSSQVSWPYRKTEVTT